MAQQSPWSLQDRPPRIEQETDFERGLFQGAMYDPNVPPGSRPMPAPENVSETCFSEPVSHDYFAGTTESAVFAAPPAFGPACPAFLSMQPNPMLNMWDATSPSSPTTPNQFHGYGFSTWTPSTEWQVSNISSLSGSHSHVAAQAAALGPGPPILQSSPVFRSEFIPIATHPDQSSGMAGEMAPAVPQQLHVQAASRSTPRARAFIQQKLQRFTGSAPENIESCWRCKSDHKKCDSGTPCRRCAALPSSGHSSIPCRRGRVCDAAAEIPFLCHMPQGAPQLLVESLPFDLQPAAKLLSRVRERRRQTASQFKGREPVAGSKYDIFCRVVNTKVPNIRAFNPFVNAPEIYTPLTLPYDDLIANIVWELEDNPEAAQLTGVGSVEDLVALLEAACLCEAQWGHRNPERRLVYNSILCLLHSMEALRLSARGLLAAEAHASCHQGNECICPALHGLTRYTLRYAEALSKTLFHKRRGKYNHWLLAFYSLCLQGHVRRALVSLEQSLRSAGGMEAAGFARPLRSAGYLHAAVSLFGQISMQNRGKLAERIRDSRPNRSLYLQQPPHPSRPGGDSRSSSWQRWREEGILEFLGRVFQVPISNSNIHYHPHHTEPSGTGTDSDSDVTIRSAPAPAGPPTTTATAAITSTARATSVAAQEVGGVGNADGGCWTIPSARNTPEPSIIDSMWSETSYGEDSGASTYYAGSLAPSSASYAGSLTPSMHSLSIVASDDDTVEDGYWG